MAGVVLDAGSDVAHIQLEPLSCRSYRPGSGAEKGLLFGTAGHVGIFRCPSRLWVSLSQVAVREALR